MKIKNSFVTNSSSTSFIVAFPSLVRNIEDLRDNIIASEPGLVVVLRECLNQRPVKITDKLLNLLTILFSIVNYSDLNQESFQMNTDQPQDPILEREDIEELIIKGLGDTYGGYGLGKDEIMEFLNKNKDKYLYWFEYCDEGGGIFGELEHNGTFNNLSHLEDSHH